LAVLGRDGYTDADGNMNEDRRAISGYAFLIDGGAVSWGSKRREIVEKSTELTVLLARTLVIRFVEGSAELLEEQIVTLLAKTIVVFLEESVAELLAKQQSTFHYNQNRFTIELSSIIHSKVCKLLEITISIERVMISCAWCFQGASSWDQPVSIDNVLIFMVLENTSDMDSFNSPDLFE
jgi:hypothetical protein